MVKSILGAAIALAAAGAFQPASAVPVTLTGTVSYSGSYVADSLFVAVIDSTTDALVSLDRIPVGSPPFTQSYSLPFDNAGVGNLLLAALLDVDNSGFDFTGPDPNPVTNGDIVGWYDSQQEATYISPATSQSGLNFTLPTGEIHGTVTLISGQTDVYIAATILSATVSAETVITSSGAYQIVGVYPGAWIVLGDSDQGTICYGDPTCASPTLVNVSVGQVVTGIDIDFSPLPVDAVSWGAVKSRYR